MERYLLKKCDLTEVIEKEKSKIGKVIDVDKEIKEYLDKIVNKIRDEYL